MNCLADLSLLFQGGCLLDELVLTQKESYLGYRMAALLEFQIGSGTVMVILNLLWFNRERLI